MAESFIFHFITSSRVLGYSLIFVGMTFEGDMSLLLTAALVRFGYFDPFDMFAIVVAGALVGDTLWFYAGWRFAGVQTRFALWLKRHMARIPITLEHGLFRKLLISKFVYGTHHPFLFSIGAQRLSFWRFFTNQVPAVMVWVSVLGGVGYLFAEALTHLKHTVKYVEVLLLLIVVTYLVIEVVVRKEVVDGESTNETSAGA